MMLPSLGNAVAADAPVIACPQDLKMCPDGSSVVRGPNCVFAPCPTFPKADHFSPAVDSLPEFGLSEAFEGTWSRIGLALAVVAFLLLGGSKL